MGAVGQVVRCSLVVYFSPVAMIRRVPFACTQAVIIAGTWAVARALRLASMMVSAMSTRRRMREVFMGYPSKVIASVIDHIFVP